MRAAAILLLLATPALASEAADFAEARLAAAEAEPLHRSEHLEAAIARLEKEAKDAEDFRALARVRLLLLRPDGALQAATRAIQLRWDDPVSHGVSGDAKLAIGDIKGAIISYTFALDPSFGPLPPSLRAAILRNCARAHLRGKPQMIKSALELAKISLTFEFVNEDGVSLAGWCEKRASMHVAAAGVAVIPGFRLVTDLGADVLARASARLRAVAAEYLKYFPRTQVGEVFIYVLNADDFAKLAPPGPAARAFYQRDERAVFAIGEKPAELDRLIAHECFHAHLHRQLEDAPAWLDEGYADYFGGFGSRGNAEPVRLRDLQVAFAGGHEVRFAELARATRLAFYDGAGPDVALRQAAAWGFVHYFRERAPARLDRYVERLLAGASAEEAFQAAFGGADLVGIESAVRAHVMALRD